MKFNYCDIAPTYFLYDCVTLPAITFKNTTISGTNNYAFSYYASGATGFPSAQYGIMINGDSTAQTIYNTWSVASGTRHLVLGTITP